MFCNPVIVYTSLVKDYRTLFFIICFCIAFWLVLALNDPQGLICR